ncbi:c-type cytochrome [Geoalkalibacter halelectricus]|uniref:Cytochrome c n=1 Tax=Geoalkalibacter halelectricus TaxID=2847045 RepID=A0ABY5ZQY0_9BACT|nr:cytochrome c [Geoalkalibacter halelectricus]MDO3378375.1 cytochrome c [Geoalkalibacter halelectricus]UWZ80305.1 cytochrome c [Geoalkalibacter halelectricus]
MCARGGCNPPLRVTALLLCVLLLGACTERPPAYPERQAPRGFLEDPAQRAAGAALFRRHCVACHGTPAEGRSGRADFFQPPAMDFSAAIYRSLDSAYLYWRIETGKNVEPFAARGSVMPAWGPHLSEEQIWQLVAHIRARAGG